MSMLRRVVVEVVAILSLFAVVGTFGSQPPAASGPDGAALYKDKCASCHGDLAEGGLKSPSADAIQAAIAKTRQMKILSDMKPADVQAVSAALSRQAQGATTHTATTAPARPADGAALYQSRCASCHGASARSDVRGSSASRIQRAIDRQRQMRTLSSLNAAQVQAIADSLSGRRAATTTSAPADGTAGTPPNTRRGRDRTRRENDD